MPDLTPFEELQQRVGPNGLGNRKPYCIPCEWKQSNATVQSGPHTCQLPITSTTRLVLDTEAPLFKAMWQPCNHCYVEGHPWLNDVPGVLIPCFTCGSRRYAPRSHAEAVLPLLDAARLNYGVTITMYKFGECRAELHGGLGAGVDDNPLDALSAAILAKEGVKV